MLKPRTADVNRTLRAKRQSLLVEALEGRQLLSATFPTKSTTPVEVGFGTAPLVPASAPQVRTESLGNGLTFLHQEDPTPVFQSLPAITSMGGGTGGSSSGSPGFVAPGTAGQFHINLIFGPNIDNPVNIAAKVAFENAAAYVESQFTDPITINLDAELGTSFASPDIIGQSEDLAVAFTPSAYDALVTRMAANASSDEAALIAQLPTRENLTVLLPPPTRSGGFSLGGIKAATANLLALGVPVDDPMIQAGRVQSLYDPAQMVDGRLTFNQNFAFDYDPSDGISPGTMDFTAVCIHEMTHALGFVSSVDDVDTALAQATTAPGAPLAPAQGQVVAATPLDLFRVRPGDGVADFSSAPRVLAPGDFVGEQVLYTGNSYDPTPFKLRTSALGEIPMSTGMFFGDGNQASHWFADEDIPGNTEVTNANGTFSNSRNIGVMDPTLAAQESDSAYSANDLRALGLIGYDLAPTASGVFTFSAPSYQVTENGGSAVITVTRIGGSTGVARINYTTADFNPATTANAAVANVDYTATSGQLIFLEGETTKQILVPILDNSTPQPDRMFEVVISPGTTGAPETIEAVPGQPALGAVPVTIEDDDTAFTFASSNFKGTESAGSATITVLRTGGTSFAATVDFSALPGSASTADFTPTSGTLSFAPGESSKTFTVPITKDTIADEGAETVALSLSNPSTGEVVSPSSATLTIQDTSAPQVSRLQLNTTGHKNVSSVTLFFSEPLATAPLTSDVVIAVRSKEGRLGTAKLKPMSVRASSYDPSSDAFTVVPSKPLKFNTQYQITLNAANVRDLAGNALDGNGDGAPGDRYVALFARGQKFSYIDRNGVKVSLQLSKGGLMDLVRSADGSAQSLSLIDTVPGESRLTGSVKPKTAQTDIAAILGDTTGVNILLPQSQFVIGSIA